MNDAIEFVRDIRHCAEPWTWNLLEEDGEITYSPDRDARTGWIRYKCSSFVYIYIIKLTNRIKFQKSVF